MILEDFERVAHSWKSHKAVDPILFVESICTHADVTCINSCTPALYPRVCTYRSDDDDDGDDGGDDGGDDDGDDDDDDDDDDGYAVRYVTFVLLYAYNYSKLHW